MSDLVERLRRLYVDTGINYVQEAADELERKDAAIAELVAVGRAVVERWDSPLWKDLPHTGEYIYTLRDAIAKHEPKQEGK